MNADSLRERSTDEKKRKQAETDRKRAEVRARLEEASKAKKAKKGFMTPDRKKKLRLLLRKKAAEELKKEQERKAAERRRIIEERCGKPKDIDNANEAALKQICKQYHERVYICEGQKWDLEREVRKRDYEISELNSQVNDLRGKFMKPTLKKVSKYENKFAKLQKKAAEFNFRNQLKQVKKKEFTLEEEDKEKKPEWSKKGEEKKNQNPNRNQNLSQSLQKRQLHKRRPHPRRVRRPRPRAARHRRKEKPRHQRKAMPRHRPPTTPQHHRPSRAARRHRPRSPWNPHPPSLHQSSKVQRG
ncbi:unnamed protein product [Trichogramma brassicae]|uniref:Troponin I n=1 Tax=Trichogramma brassicae TaxID=86971 RepID=A0A6H5ISV7_9HYME|nr:unnamed protein product [Trichogramma brassicae]